MRAASQGGDAGVPRSSETAPPPPGPQEGPRHRPGVGSWGGIVDLERGIPVRRGVGRVSGLLLKCDVLGVTLVPERCRRADDPAKGGASAARTLLAPKHQSETNASSCHKCKFMRLHANLCHSMQIHAIETGMKTLKKRKFMPLKLPTQIHAMEFPGAHRRERSGAARGEGAPRYLRRLREAPRRDAGST